MERTMRVAVFGSGAVGGYFGGRIAKAGHDVTFIARGAHLDSIRRDGLRVTSIAGDFVVHPASATDDPASIGPVDLVLVGVKAWQIAEAAAGMRALMGPDTMVVPLENGVEAPYELARALGAQHALGGLCRVLAFVTGPGQIQHAGIDPYLAFGELNGARSERVDRLLRTLESVPGFRVEVPDDIRVAMWNKFLVIASWGAVGAVTRAPVGVVRNIPESKDLMLRTLREVCDVAAAHGVQLTADSAERTMAFVETLPADGTTSMQRDIMAGKPSELEAQVGAVVRLAAEAGVEVPVHRTIYEALLPQERVARGQLPQ
ncbi:MAG: 2-dehydropantoate 2-reductase [Gemmatimonadaceae bacterium]